MNRFAQVLSRHTLALRRGEPEILQVNLGKLCNLTCTHCHVNAGPNRKEIMSRITVDRVISWFAATTIPTLDLTGGAPEMAPDFQYMIEYARGLSPKRRIIDRCNLTILLEPGFDGLAEFLAENEVEIIASMPCYSPENVNAQRGDGVFDSSIVALQRLNQLGYGREPKLPLHLIYNPIGAFLPGPQAELEASYQRELGAHFGIVFNNLYTLTNLPIARFASWLRHQGEYEAYLELLANAFNPATVEGLMCRNTISVSWEGKIFDCDFNQMLDLPLGGERSRYLWELDPGRLAGQPIATADHCFGCTAGAGSSCGGALV